MSAQNWGALVLLLLGAAVVSAVAAWSSSGRRIWGPASLLLLVAAGVLAAAPPEVAVDGRGLTTVLVALGGLLATAGGGPVTALVFDLVDRRERDLDSLDLAGRVLRGGAWIGALERTAVFATVVAGWPEGLAVVLGVKSLARYPELRTPGTAERFIIGTFTSVLWACGCAAVVVLAGPAALRGA